MGQQVAVADGATYKRDIRSNLFKEFMHVGRPPRRHSSGRCMICGIPINVRSPSVTEPHYYGNVYSMYCSCWYAVHIMVLVSPQSECVSWYKWTPATTAVHNLVHWVPTTIYLIWYCVHNLAHAFSDRALELSSLSEFGNWSVHHTTHASVT